MAENKDAPTNVPRTKAGEHAAQQSENDNTPPTGPQSGPLSPFGGNPSPALDTYVKGMEDEVHLHPPIDPTPPDPGGSVDARDTEQKEADTKRKRELEEQAKRDNKHGDKK